MHPLKSSLLDIIAALEPLREEPSGERVPFVDASPLRKMQRSLEALLLNEQLERNEWTLAYTLYSLIDSLFYNMSGDVPTGEEACQVQVDFLRRFVPHCKNAEGGLEQQDLSKSVLALSELVKDFFETLNQLNQL